MNTMEKTLQRLEKNIETAQKSNPHSAEILSAYRPLILARARLVGTLDLKDEVSLILDEGLFKEGVPLFRQNAFFRPDDPFGGVARSLLTALRQGFPGQSGVWDRLGGVVDGDASGLYEHFKQFPGDGDGVISRWAEMLGADVQVAGFLVRAVVRVILEKRARGLAELIKDLDWEKGYCPLCGSFPDVAKHRDGTGQRWLHCPLCGHEWRFRRVVCPSCENDDQKTMNYFHVADKEKESCSACEKCKCYLITVTKVSDMAEYEPDISVLSLAHLDIIMQEKGYLPMTECQWSRYL
jgi:FdhE protein